MGQAEKSPVVKFFSERLVEASRGVSQASLANALGIGQSNVSMYLRGERVPSLEVFRLLCETLGVSADWLLGLADGPQKGGSSVTASNSTVAAFGGTVAGGDCSRCPLMQAARETVERNLKRKGKI